MKKLMTFSLLLLFSLALASACFAEPVVDGSLPTFPWERSAKEHWRILPTGELSEQGPHKMTDAVCTVCGSEIWAFDDGSADISDYNEQGDLIRYTSFGADGNALIELSYAYEYDAEGRMLLTREFTGDVLTGEVIYTVSAAGESIPVSQVAYYDDDTWAINEYDEHGNLNHAATFDPDGSMSFEEFSEYAQDAEGSWYEIRKTSRFADGATFYSEYNEFGDPTLRRNTDADGSVWEDSTYEYHYAGGSMLWKKQYTSGALTLEVNYHPDGYAEKETEYFDDGTRMLTQYNDHSDPVSITSYAADGSTEMVQTYEYDYADDMTWLVTRAYTDGILIIQTEYANEDGWNYACRETIYDTDGSYVVYEFDPAGEILSQAEYDPTGNLIR